MDVAKKSNISAIYGPIRFGFEIFEAAQRPTSTCITHKLRSLTMTSSWKTNAPNYLTGSGFR